MSHWATLHLLNTSLYMTGMSLLYNGTKNGRFTALFVCRMGLANTGMRMIEMESIKGRGHPLLVPSDLHMVLLKRNA